MAPLLFLSFLGAAMHQASSFRFMTKNDRANFATLATQALTQAATFASVCTRGYGVDQYVADLKKWWPEVGCHLLLGQTSGGDLVCEEAGDEMGGKKFLKSLKGLRIPEVD